MAMLKKVLCMASSSHRNLSNNSGTTHYDSLQGSYWADQKDSHNEVIMISLQGQ